MSDRVSLAGLQIDRVTEEQVVAHVLAGLQSGSGGWIGTPNVHICWAAQRDRDLHALISAASLLVPDGMPLLWAGRLRGTPLAERVTGASLIFSLSAAAAQQGRGIYLLGGRPGVPERAGLELSRRFVGLKVVGTDCPPIGFDISPLGIDAVRERVVSANPDIVYVGLGFPRQESLITQLAPVLPNAWFVACGSAIPFAAGVLARAPRWMQNNGLEWMFRLSQEPRRLCRRYLINDLPFAAALLGSAATEYVITGRGGRLYAGHRSQPRHSREGPSASARRVLARLRDRPR